jgi:hypothetical protein
MNEKFKSQKPSLTACKYLVLVMLCFYVLKYTEVSSGRITNAKFRIDVMNVRV